VHFNAINLPHPNNEKHVLLLMKYLPTSLVSLTFGSLALSSAQAFVLANPGFESEAPLVDDGNGIGKWNAFSDGSVGNQFSNSTVNPRNGAQSLRLEMANADGFAGVFQDVPVLAGGMITYSGWHTLSSGNAGGSEIRIEFRDSVGNTEVSRTGNLAPVIGDTYEEFSLIETVPAGADTARVVYAIQSFGAAPPQVVDVDDMSVSGSAVVPEPSASLLALLCVVGFAARRLR
jgi:hypothetical protein